MQEKQIILRKVKEQDKDLLLIWRNEKECRENSFTKQEISFSEHQKWFDQVNGSEMHRLYICTLEETPIGQIHIKLENRFGYISYSIAKEYRGQGYGEILLRLLEKEIRDVEINVDILAAQVKKSNIASQAKFEKLGYKKQEKSNYIEYEKNIKENKVKDIEDQSIPDYRGWGYLFLTNNRNTLPLYEWLCHEENNVNLFSERLTIQQIQHMNPKIIISYNYNYIIPHSIITNFFTINLHISLLPWNKGANPNFWSFIFNTPKGVTIHEIDDTLDTGDILYQEELFLDEGYETFQSSYEKLHLKIRKLFMKNWVSIKERTVIPQQQKGNGSYHTIKEFEIFTEKNPVNWKEIINLYKERIETRK